MQQVIGIELSSSACEDFAINLDEFENVSLYQGKAEGILPHLETKADAVIVDPPRSGLEPAALDALLAMQPPPGLYLLRPGHPGARYAPPVGWRLPANLNHPV